MTLDKTDRVVVRGGDGESLSGSSSFEGRPPLLSFRVREGKEVEMKR